MWEISIDLFTPHFINAGYENSCLVQVCPQESWPFALPVVVMVYLTCMLQLQDILHIYIKVLKTDQHLGLAPLLTATQMVQVECLDIVQKVQ